MSIDIEPRPQKRSLNGQRAKGADGADGTAEAVRTAAPPAMPGRRNPKWIALGIVAICLGGLLSYVIYSRAASEVTAVAMSGTVYRGASITQADLTTVNLNPTSGVPYVPADQLPSMVGKKATLDLAAGSVLNPDAVRDVKFPADARSVVGLRLANGRAPLGQLVPGARVRLVALPEDGAAPGAADGYRGKAYQALVVSEQPDPDGAGVLVNVDVANPQAQDVSILAAQDRIALIRDADK